jgi:hypothetical protein
MCFMRRSAMVPRKGSTRFLRCGVLSCHPQQEMGTKIRQCWQAAIEEEEWLGDLRGYGRFGTCGTLGEDGRGCGDADPAIVHITCLSCTHKKISNKFPGLVYEPTRRDCPTALAQGCFLLNLQVRKENWKRKSRTVGKNTSGRFVTDDVRVSY